jgi:hypothetical protein
MKFPVILRSALILALSSGSAALIFSALSAVVSPPSASNSTSPPARPAVKAEFVKNQTKSVWQPFTPQQGKFTVLMPGVPEETQKAGVSGFEVNRSQDSVIYGVSYIDFPIAPKDREGGVTEVFVGTKTGFEENRHVLVSDRAVELQGHPGREMKFTRADGVVTHCRVYVVNQRLYLVVARTTREQALAKSIEGFLNSFQIAAQ